MKNSLPTSINNFLAGFSENATSWNQATDEIMDLARITREYSNDQLDTNILAIDFRSINTPAEWNTRYKNQVREIFPTLPTWAQEEIIEKVKSW